VVLLDSFWLPGKNVATMASEKTPAKLETNAYSLMAARFWHGMTTKPLMQLFAQGKLRNVGLLQWPMVGSATLITAGIGSPLAMIQRWRYTKKIEATEIRQPPIFIIGHWRSGTTLLHEFMSLDERHTCPTTFECFAPSHCVVSGSFVKPMRFLLPAKRPMDNMPAGWERPQEDEFALMNLGLPSPYRQVAFPNNPPVDLEYFDFIGVPAEARRRWQEVFRNFLKMVAMRSPERRLVLKNPLHLGRVAVLREVFPDAIFIHIVRDPRKIFASTMKLWKSLYKFQAFQIPKHRGLEEYVFRCFEQMYGQFEQDRQHIEPHRFHELRYEDLVENPLGQLETLYNKLGLGGYEAVVPKLQAYLQENKDYKTNKFQFEDELTDEIDRRWGRWMRPYGYCQEVASGVH
jgi:hypothetical protein